MKKGKLKYKISLRSSIILLSLLLTIFFSGMFSAFYYQSKSQDVRNYMYSYLDSTSFLISNYLDERISSIFTRVYSIVSGNQFQSQLREYLTSDNKNQYALTATSVIGYISELRMSDPFISSVYIYTPKGIFYDYLSLTNPDFDFLDTDIYKQYVQNGSPIIYSHKKIKDPLFKESEYVIPLVIRAQINGYAGDVFVITNLSSKNIESYLSQSLMNEVDIVVTDQDKRLIVSSNNNMESQYISMLDFTEDNKITISNNEFIVSENSLKRNEWRVVTIAHKNIIDNSLIKDLYVVVIIIITTIVVALTISTISSNSIVRPLKILGNYMLRVTEGDYDIHFDYNCNKEVMNMGKSFNYMVDQISSLIGKLNLTIEHLKIEKDNVKQEQIMKREAELKAYQTEINPHFLYNALNSIVWLSTEDRSDDISLLAVELANFYENRLHGGDTIITIGSEIEQVRSYMAIQKICYGDSIQTNFNIDESLNDYLIVKLVLQPLVENSIYHGFQVKKTTLEREQSNQITIKVYAENIGINSDILIEIYDNGKGMPLGRIKDINNKLNKQCSISHDSYGIYNVNERIKLYFGEQYGLQYDTQVTEGTKAIIRIPRIEQYIDSSTQRDNVNEIIKIKNSR